MTDLEVYRTNVSVWNRRLGTSVPNPEVVSPACLRGYAPAVVALAKCLSARGSDLVPSTLLAIAGVVYTKSHHREWGGRLAVEVSQDPTLAMEAYSLVAECIALRQERGGLMNQVHRCLREGKDVDTWE